MAFLKNRNQDKFYNVRNEHQHVAPNSMLTFSPFSCYADFHFHILLFVKYHVYLICCKALVSLFPTLLLFYFLFFSLVLLFLFVILLLINTFSFGYTDM